MKSSIYGIASKIIASESQLFYKEVCGRAKIVLDMDLNSNTDLHQKISGTFSYLTSKNTKIVLLNSRVVRNK